MSLFTANSAKPVIHTPTLRRAWRVRRGRPEDAGAITAATRRMAWETEGRLLQADLEGWVRAFLQAKHRVGYIVAEDADTRELGGFFLLSLEPSDFNASTYLVIETAASEFPEQGIGSTLFAMTERIARHVGAREIRLIVRRSNFRGFKFWHSRGFEPADDYLLMKKVVF